ncbi:MAG: TetR family transcriptional regulator [Myxococcaceae bacterium]|nr:TetR family transcriptional regulator [Myxococcaceae bacterium]
MLRQRHRERVRDALVEAAFALFAKQGFEATTVVQIAARAGVGRRTFFRYFAGKEAVLFPDRERRLGAFRRLESATRGEDPVQAVRQGMLELARDYQQQRQRVVRQQRIIAKSAATLAYDFERDLEWEAAVARLLGDRPGEPKALRWQARLAAGALLGVSRVVLREWYGSDAEEDLTAKGTEAMDLVFEGFARSLRQLSRRASRRKVA